MRVVREPAIFALVGSCVPHSKGQIGMLSHWLCIDRGHRAGASDLGIFSREDRPLRCTAWFARFLGSYGATERDSALAADDLRDVILHQSFGKVEQVPQFHRDGSADNQRPHPVLLHLRDGVAPCDHLRGSDLVRETGSGSALVVSSGGEGLRAG